MINCIAIDDEPLALELLKTYISKISYLNLVATCENAFDAMEEMQKQAIDLLFIDIQIYRHTDARTNRASIYLKS